jgi:phosphopentomutase
MNSRLTALIIVIDGFGLGSLPDADKFGDVGANTILHVAQSAPGPKWPILKSLGLGNCSESVLGFSLPGCEAVDVPLAGYGVMNEKSPGRDSTTGHWEIAGITLDEPFPNFPPDFPSFPEKLVNAFEKATGRKIIGNKAASGTEIIDELGEEHIRTGFPICYTAGDSIFQIAAHEEVIALEELYKMCKIARTLCDEYKVPRVIARPFVGTSGNFIRTSRRKDFSISLPKDSVFDFLEKKGIETIGIGKIGDIFNQTGFSKLYNEKGNALCLKSIKTTLSEESAKPRCIFSNLVDTDMLYGHRRDAMGYFNAIKKIDDELLSIISLLNMSDVLLITADHGCDPTFKGTDHTREYVPLLVYQPGIEGKSLGLRKQFSDVAASLLSYFGFSSNGCGDPFL